MEKGQDWKADVNACLRRRNTAAATEVMGEILKKETRWNRELALKELVDLNKVRIEKSTIPRLSEAQKL